MLRSYERYKPIDFSYNLESTSPEFKINGIAHGYITTTADKRGVIFRYIEKQLNVVSSGHTNLDDAQKSFMKLLHDMMKKQKEMQNATT